MKRPTPSFVVATVALALAAGGTSAYAASSIGSPGIRDNTVRSIDVKDNALRTVDIKDGTLRPKDFRRGRLPRGPQGETGPRGPQGPMGEGRWLLVNADGEIEGQSGGFEIKAAYPTLANTAPDGQPSNALRANGNVYIDANEDLLDNGMVAVIALQNQTDQNGDAVTSGRAPGSDANPEFSGEVSATTCGLPGIVACAPAGTDNTQHFVVSPRLSDGQPTDDDNRKRFYVVITGDSSDLAPAS